MIEYTIKLTEQDLATINAGLQELPMKIAAPLVVKINQQLREQRSAAETLRAGEAVG